MVTAKRLAQSFVKRGVYKGSTAAATFHTADACDHSDVHELRLKLFKRRGFNGWPSSDPQLRLLDALARDVATGAITTKAAFNLAAADVLAANSGFDVRAHVAASEALIVAGRQDMTANSSSRSLPKALRMVRQPEPSETNP